MNEIREKQKDNVSDVRSIQESTAIIRENEQIMGRSAVRIGKELEYIKKNKTYKQWGYETIVEYGTDRLGYKSSTLTQLMRIGRNLNCQSSGNIDNFSIERLSWIANIEDAAEQEKFIKENSIEDMTRQELKKAVNAKRKALEEKRKAEQAKIKTEDELQQLREELEKERNKEPEIKEKTVTKKVIPDNVKEQLKQVKSRKEELEERVGKLDKYKSEIRNYNSKKKQTKKEIEQLQDYKRELEQKNEVLTQRAEVVQGVRNGVEKLKKNKGKIEQLLQRDINLTGPDIKNIEIEAEFLKEMSDILYEYVDYQRGNKNNFRDDIVEIN